VPIATSHNFLQVVSKRIAGFVRWWSPWWIAWIVVAIVGAMEAVGSRFDIDPDNISYLNLSDLYASGRWAEAVNGYWSPAYPVLLGVLRRLLQPSLYHEIALAHFLSFLIYLGAFASFQWFVRQLEAVQRARQSRLPPDTQVVTFGTPSEIACATGLFIWGAISLTTIAEISPDMLLAAVVFLIAGCLIKIRSRKFGVKTLLLLGLLLGFGYLLKAVMFPVGCLVAFTCCIGLTSLRKTVVRTLLVSATFFAVSGPQIAAMSELSGHLSYGEVGPLAYAAKVNWFTRWWIGDPPGSGIPVHAIKRIHQNPDAFSFATSRASDSYPFWDEPAYWLEGIRPRFSLREEFPVVVNFLGMYVQLFGVLVVGYIALVLLGWGNGRAQLAYIMLPALAVFGLYALVYAEARYFGAWAPVLFLVGISGLVFPSPRTTARNIVLLAVVVAYVVPIVRSSVVRAHQVAGLVTGYTMAHNDWRVAARLRNAGVRPGDKVASIGRAFDGYWARLARVQIAMEIPETEAPKYWTSDGLVKKEIQNAFASAGARAIIMNKVPVDKVDPAWVTLGNGYFAQILP
jgi:hypothetical protein